MNRSAGSSDPAAPGPFLLVDPPVVSIEEYRASGGGTGLERARSMGPAAIIDEIRRSGLRGRGGAGFPTATKWTSVRNGGGRHHYAVCNGAEEYLFGEEKALLEVIEGNDPLPRWLPPYLHGLFVTDPQLGWDAHYL